MIAAENNKKQGLMTSTALLAAQFFILVPISLYFTNIDEMHLSFLDMLKLCLIPALLVFLLVVVVGSLCPEKIRQYLVAVLAGVSILVWLQSNVLLWDYGLLDGRLIDWQKDAWRGWIDSSIWMTGIAGAIFMARKYGQWILKAAMAVFVLQLITTIILIIQHKESVNPLASGSDEPLQKLYQFSGQKNILHLMVDGFQSDVFNDLINAPKLGYEYKKAFSGFTFYPETLGVFPYTRFSVPAFLGGRIFSNEMPQDEFVDEVLSGKNIINLAYQEGMDVDLGVTYPYWEKRYAHLHHTNLYNFDRMNSPLEAAAEVLDLAMFRIAPHFIKPYVYNNQQWLLASVFAKDNGMQFKYFQHTYFLWNFIRQMSVDRDKPVYKYIHIMNTHNPMVVDAACKYAGKVSPMTRETLTYQSKCTLDTIARLFERMKEMGIYDNTLILVHGDHGGWTGTHRTGKPIIFIDGNAAPEWVKSLASPLLAIKPPKASGNLVVSRKHVSLADIPDTISDIMEWNVLFGQSSIMEIDEQKERLRHFYFYGWRKNEWSKKYAGPIQQFIVKGSHYESPWELGKLYFPQDKEK